MLTRPFGLPDGAIPLPEWPDKYSRQTGRPYPVETARMTRDQATVGRLPCRRTEKGRFYVMPGAEWDALVAVLDGWVSLPRRNATVSGAAVLDLLAKLARVPLEGEAAD